MFNPNIFKFTNKINKTNIEEKLNLQKEFKQNPIMKTNKQLTVQDININKKIKELLKFKLENPKENQFSLNNFNSNNILSFVSFSFLSFSLFYLFKYKYKHNFL